MKKLSETYEALKTDLTLNITKGHVCECGGKLIFKHQNDGQFMGGYVYSYKCDKCQMLHFFQTKS